VTYTNSSDAPVTTTRVVTFQTNDGTTVSNTSTQSVSVAAVNDTPVVTAAGGTTAATEQVAIVIDGTVTVADVDLGNQASATVSITSNFQVGDVLTFVNQNGITGSYNAGTGVLTLTGASSIANYQTALRSVTYTASIDNPSTTTRVVTFATNDGTIGSNASTQSVSVAAVNDAPVATASAGPTAANEQVATAIDGALTLTDADNANQASATVSITANFTAGQDVLSFTNQNGITGSYNAGTGVMTLTGASSVANYQTALRSVTYTNSSDTPTTTARTITFATNDGALASNSSTIVLNPVAVNDAPTNTVPGGQTATNAGAVLNIAGIAIADLDHGGAGGMTTVLAVNNGTIEVGTIGGGAVVTNSGTASVTLTGTLAQINATLASVNNVGFKATSGFVGTSNLTVTTNDGGAFGSGGAQSSAADVIAISVSAPGGGGGGGGGSPPSPNGTSGDDSIAGGNGSEAFDGGAGNDTVSGGAGDDSVRGLEDNDSIDGGSGNDDVNGNTGNDIVVGGTGNDTVRGGQGSDYVDGGADSDAHVNGNIGNDEVHGGEGNDTCYGGQDNDTVFGDAGDDRLSGDLGNDILIGGDGADRFAIVRGGGADWVQDFNFAAGDRIQLAVGQTYTVTTYLGQTIIDLGGGTTIGLSGVAGFDASWVVFG
jgi:hypothetical protein